ncbi:MAG: NAD-glutamate dehydrogenase [Deltaproteobacteria bacterium]|nr:NAD-glutamate dehydrogenase [Deltaproteobacteria bacterium]
MPNQTAVLRETLLQGLRDTLDSVLPSFLRHMPPAYLADTDEAERHAHLRAVVAARASGQPPRLTLRSEDGARWTFISPEDRPGMLAGIFAQLPQDATLRLVKVHVWGDGQLAIDTVVLGNAPRFNPGDPEQAARREAVLAHARSVGADEALVDRFLRGSAEEYVRAVTPLRAVRSAARWGEVRGTDDTLVHLEPERDPALSRVVLTVGNGRPRRMAERCAALLGAHGVNILRAFVEMIDDGKERSVLMLSFVVRGPEGRALDPDGALWRRLAPDLARMKWATDAALALNRQAPELPLARCEAVVALGSLAHQALVRENPYAWARARIMYLASKHLGLCADIAALLEERFAPARPLDDAAFAQQAALLHDRIDRTVDGDAARRAFTTMLAAVEKTLRTNYHLPRRYGLALRLDPSVIQRPDAPAAPFGLFFVHGLGFDGFHLRFRDIARGGVRVVRPATQDQLVAETDRLYDEVFGLAHAQQLKNKDIPEGGAKAVIVSGPETSVTRAFKGFADGLLDLLVRDPGGRVLDRYGRPETLYLGPDENITPELIDWVVARAALRGHPLAAAFMSSKPGAGINHKEYGVTSEGVTVFLEVALKHVGIDPRTTDFTVKLTGGPDGDVAGNELKILAREFGPHARVVGLADGSGALEDPDGLDTQELLRLVARSEPVARFDPSRLGPRGRLVPVDAEDGVRARNTLHNRVVADAFIPAGGRPQTIHAGNWQDFLRPDGTASARVIVEGANLFITPEARQRLGERGVLVLKDSSANKCGVICSSFEITASHLLTEAEFLAHKPRFVAEVLVRLRSLARAEAELLFRERARHPAEQLPELSVRLSKGMMRVQDAIDGVFDDLSPEDRRLADGLVLEHLPPVLREVAGDRVASRLPAAYARSIVSSSLAARMVYREGLDWVAQQPDEVLGQVAFRYLRAEREASRLADAIRAGETFDRAQVALLVARAGARASVEG